MFKCVGGFLGFFVVVLFIIYLLLLLFVCFLLYCCYLFVFATEFYNLIVDIIR